MHSLLTVLLDLEFSHTLVSHSLTPDAHLVLSSLSVGEKSTLIVTAENKRTEINHQSRDNKRRGILVLKCKQKPHIFNH